jgi:16S rRNA (guanine966-N2)-methyltransferase
MRIIAGKAKGRRLIAPKARGIRPTRDDVKGSVFSMIQGHVDKAVVLDLFAGTGNLGLEALSQGAKKAIFVEKERIPLRALVKNIDLCGFRDCAEIISRDAQIALKLLMRRGEKADLIFIDPPYGSGYADKTLRFIDAHDMVTEQGTIVVEHGSEERLPDRCGRLERTNRKRYGDTVISIFRRPLSPRSFEA